jgi:ADP-ribosylation factor-binding protein GGA
MDTCGDEFRAKVGKFHFLNELIKLVSKNYLGDQTDETVRNRILDSLFMWTKNYPKETKIKEAYDMLKNQGVLHQPIKNIKTNVQSATKGSILPDARSKDDENSEMLKKLCQSKNPKDIEEANLWIQNMVREVSVDEMRFYASGKLNVFFCRTRDEMKSKTND